jgi:hypothetical protein
MTFFADDPINHPISTHSTCIHVVCSFVAEAEYGGLFAAARTAVDERNILANLDHPQPATVIFLRQWGRDWPSQSNRMSKDVKIVGHAVPLAT